MKNSGIAIVVSLFILSGLTLFSSCATIVGGSKYYAHITVDKHPKAEILYKGYSEGKGSAVLKVPRREANVFAINVREEGCEPQTFLFKRRVFRGWAFAGTLLLFTGTGGTDVPIPYGLFIDLIDGSLWKPDIEQGVTRMNIKHYNYLLNYDKCEAKEYQNIDLKSNPLLNMQGKSKAQKLKELKELLDNGTLTQEEFDKEKKKVLDQD